MVSYKGQLFTVDHYPKDPLETKWMAMDTGLFIKVFSDTLEGVIAAAEKEWDEFIKVNGDENGNLDNYFKEVYGE